MHQAGQWWEPFAQEVRVRGGRGAACGARAWGGDCGAWRQVYPGLRLRARISDQRGCGRRDATCVVQSMDEAGPALRGKGSLVPTAVN